MALARSAKEDPVPEDIKADIIKGLWQWNTTPTSLMDIRKWDVYFQYYTAECQKAIGYGRGEYTTVRKHKDITVIAKKLEDGYTKEKIKQSLLPLDTQQRPTDVRVRMAEGSARLVARLISMVDIGPLPYGIQGRAPIPWDNEDWDLRTLLGQYFEESSTDPEGIKFEEEFTAFNLRRFSGLRIQWSNNLANHLRLMDNDTTLCIFHHVAFLRYQNSTIFPDGLAKETLQTLALLFPRYNKSTRRWLLSERSSSRDTIYLDQELLNCERLMPEERCAEKFKFWRDELITLKEKFEKPRSTSIVQFWYDRRNKVQWYTFWVAVLVLCLTIFFGLVQSIEGALQVYKAYHPNSK
ncbi:unnamed protein product [Periconia digitata]|uniref:Uncharacterized protein n=1 Tax=Periconia digitata TaxID=1303443 RepID=A0A9W4XYK5_9PLEO|nr:unnamed protein product [Periconia digitata]